MPGKRDGKPKGRMSSYAFFVQTCREEHKKKHPGENVVFQEFTRKCADRWKEMTNKEKRRFEEMAEKDKARYNREMDNYQPPPGSSSGSRKRKRTKDPNAPKRALSAFFFYCAEHRAEIRAKNPGYGVADVAKTLGKQWEKVGDRSRYEQMAANDKKRYEAEMAAYKGGSPRKVAGRPAVPVKKTKEESEEDDDDEEDDEEDDDEEEDDE